MIIAQIGIIPAEPRNSKIFQRSSVQRAKTPKSGVNPAIGSPPDNKYEQPLKIVCEANVAINAGIPIEATIQPFKIPIKVAIAIEIITANHIFIPEFTIKYAHTTLTSAIIEPIERSIPAIKITNVIPIDAIP